jgi:hypothetical protein
MRRYKSNPDACYGIALLSSGLLALLLTCASVELVYGHPGFYISRVPRFHYPIAALLVAAVIARWQLRRSGIRWWAYLGLLIPALYAILFCANWFRSGMHDVALAYFDSHGRFGCQDEHYDGYLFRDDTAPWILFGPLVLATLGHWLYRSPAALARFSASARSLIRWSTTYEPRKTT